MLCFAGTKTTAHVNHQRAPAHPKASTLRLETTSIMNQLFFLRRNIMKLLNTMEVHRFCFSYSGFYKVVTTGGGAGGFSYPGKNVLDIV